MCNLKKIIILWLMPVRLLTGFLDLIVYSKAFEVIFSRALYCVTMLHVCYLDLNVCLFEEFTFFMLSTNYDEILAFAVSGFFNSNGHLKRLETILHLEIIAESFVFNFLQ